MKHITAGLMIFALAQAASALEFTALTSNATAYHGERVTIKGVARIQGLSFHLYGNESDAQRFASEHKGIVVSQNVDGPRYDQYDNCWVAITGKVNAHQPTTWGYPCMIFLDKIKLLSKPAGKQHVVIEGIFINNDPQDFVIVLLNDHGTMYAKIPLAAHQSNGTGIREGEVEIRSLTGQVVSRSALRFDLKYFDFDSHKYYFRIMHGRPEPLTPSDAKRLGQ
jgi:hypothetical protein